MARVLAMMIAIEQRGLPTMLVAILLSLACFFAARAQPPRAGSPLHIATSVIPSDVDDLECRSPLALDGYGCKYRPDHTSLPAARVLTPYSTTDREIVLMAGLFDRPNVAAWLARTRSSALRPRVFLSCEVRVLGVISQAELRWRRSDHFAPQHDLLAARVVQCRIDGER